MDGIYKSEVFACKLKVEVKYFATSRIHNLQLFLARKCFNK